MTRWLSARVVADRAVAAVLLVASAPALGLAALAVRRDGGPAVIRVPRIGRSGAALAMLKLRSMRAGGVDGLAGGAALTSGSDERVTPLGRRLRRWRLDELPQLVHVLRGEMALIGPRPEAPEYVELSDTRWAHVLRTAPGIAGPTQVLVDAWERAALDPVDGDEVYRRRILPVKLAIDAWYLDHATPGIDLAVVRALVGPGRSSARAALEDRVRRALPGVVESIGA